MPRYQCGGEGCAGGGAGDTSPGRVTTAAPLTTARARGVKQQTASHHTAHCPHCVLTLICGTGPACGVNVMFANLLLLDDATTTLTQQGDQQNIRIIWSTVFYVLFIMVAQN